MNASEHPKQRVLSLILVQNESLELLTSRNHEKVFQLASLQSPFRLCKKEHHRLNLSESIDAVLFLVVWQLALSPVLNPGNAGAASASISSSSFTATTPEEIVLHCKTLSND